MKPGRELDALVAEKVMGLEVYKTTNPKARRMFSGTETFFMVKGTRREVPRYSINIAAAWEVVKHLRDKPGLLPFTMSDHDPLTHGLRWSASFQQLDSYGETPQLAICFAALNAVGYRWTRTGKPRG